MDTVNKWLTLIANLGVVVGLIILAVEVNQNTRATVAAASGQIYDQSLEYFALGMDNDVIAEARFKQSQGDDLMPFEEDQLWWHQYYNFRILEHIYLQYRRGYLEDREWRRYARIIRARLDADPIARRVWQEREYSWTEDFRNEVNRLRSMQAHP